MRGLQLLVRPDTILRRHRDLAGADSSSVQVGALIPTPGRGPDPHAPAVSADHVRGFACTVSLPETSSMLVVAGVGGFGEVGCGRCRWDSRQADDRRGTLLHMLGSLYHRPHSGVRRGSDAP
jgi:hypothetical protein